MSQHLRQGKKERDLPTTGRKVGVGSGQQREKMSKKGAGREGKRLTGQEGGVNGHGGDQKKETKHKNNAW